MSLHEQIKENQVKIHDLAVAIDIWTQNATVPADVKAKVKEEYDRLQFKLQELEIQAQQIKMDTMGTVLALFKGEKKL